MPATYTCWKCASALTEIFLPLARLTECPSCHAQLHVCRMCVFFDPAAAQQCREPVADAVADKQRANFCGYFQLATQPLSSASGQADVSRRQLDALFGDETSSAAVQPEDPADAAREQLEQLFKK
jgi:hypothetical protein